jgi:DNA anti-recombination protein RmuC
LLYTTTQMEKTEILLLVNSVLLAIISVMFLVIGYFLKDLHKDFKILIERVNKLYTDLYSHINLFDGISKMFQKQIDTLENRIEQLEEKKAKSKDE